MWIPLPDMFHITLLLSSSSAAWFFVVVLRWEVKKWCASTLVHISRNKRLGSPCYGSRRNIQYSSIRIWLEVDGVQLLYCPGGPVCIHGYFIWLAYTSDRFSVTLPAILFLFCSVSIVSYLFASIDEPYLTVSIICYNWFQPIADWRQMIVFNRNSSI